MTTLNLESDHEPAEFLSVLAAYHAEQAVLRQTDPEHNGWVQRLISIGEIETERLSQIHGRLIAFGYLKFQLTGRSSGVQYQISPSGKEAIQTASSKSKNRPESVDQNAEAA
jgi:hypothetical protein